MDFISKNDGKFDVIFNHMRGGYLMLPLAKYLKNPIISIMHLPIFNEVGEVLKLFKSPNIITISNNQRKPVPKVKYLAIVYNGINISEFKFDDKPEDYFLFIGTMGEYKTPHLAIQAAKKAKVKLILAGGKKREPYFSTKVAPLIDNKNI